MTLKKVLTIAGYSLPVILHGIGIVLLYKARGQLPNQRMVTLNLAVAEFLYCVSRIIYHATFLSGTPTKLTYVLQYCFISLFFCVIRFAMLHIIIDRFLDVWLNIKYQIYVNKKTLTKIIILVWIAGFVVGVGFILLEGFNVISRLPIMITRLSVDFIIIVSAVSTFIYLFVKVQNVINGLSTQQQRKNRLQMVWLRFKIPIMMVLTLILFNISSSLLWTIRDDSGKAKYYSYALALDLCGWCSDAFIYVFFQKRVRILLSSSFRRRDRNQIEDSQISQISQSI